MRQKITKDIIKTVKIRSDKPSEVIDEIILSMWEFVAQKIKESTDNAVYLRYLGTFYGNKKMEEIVGNHLKLKKERDGVG